MTPSAVAPVSSPALFGDEDIAAARKHCHCILQTSIGLRHFRLPQMRTADPQTRSAPRLSSRVNDSRRTVAFVTGLSMATLPYPDQGVWESWRRMCRRSVARCRRCYNGRTESCSGARSPPWKGSAGRRSQTAATAGSGVTWAAMLYIHESESEK